MSGQTPNKDLDKAIKDMLKTSASQPFDLQLKALNTAIAWEKAKSAILGDDDDFDPDQI